MFGKISVLVVLFFCIVTLSANENFGNCLDFDGVDDFVIVPSNTALNNPSFTVEFWIQLDNPGEWQGIIDKGRNTNSDWFFLTGDTGATEGVTFGVGNGSSIEDVQYSWNDTEWHHVAGTYDGSVLKLYVDGDLKGSDAKSMSNTANNIIIGARCDQSWFNAGKIDEIRIWDSARTQAEISDNRYTELVGNETNLIAYWKLDSSSGSTAFDSANNHNGTLHNMSDDDWINSGVPLGTAFSGTISVDTIWDENMMITGDVTINNNVTLTIDSGVRVYFDGHHKLIVDNAQIVAEGTLSDSIRFYANPNTKWHGIRFYNTASDSSKIVHCIFEDGLATGSGDEQYGGAIFNKLNHKLRVDKCRFSNNSAISGGAIYVDYAHCQIQNSLFENNTAENGGAVSFYSFCEPDFINNTVRNNTATSNGGGIFSDFANPTINRSVIQNNYTSGDGGGLYFTSEDAVITNCLITDNEAGNEGGGLLTTNCSLTFYNCTVVNNVAASGGGIADYDSDSQVVNSIFYGNQAADGAQIWLYTNPILEFHYCNIFGGVDDFGGIGGTNFSGIYEHCFSSNPQFVSNNDYHLTLLSPSINSGDPLTSTGQTGSIDLDGKNRFFDSAMASGELDNVLDRIDQGCNEYSLESAIIGHESIFTTNLTLSDDYIIPEGVTATFDAGATWEFGSGVGLNIYGNLIASGIYDNWVTFTASNPETGWCGLNFVSTSGNGNSSTLEYCLIEYGTGDGSGQENGGNLYLEEYDEIMLTNCKIQNGEAQNGAGIFSEQSNIELYSCVLSGNNANANGGAIYADQSQATLINLTIVDNNAIFDGGALYFANYAGIEPEIANCVIWFNGNADTAIWPDNDALTDVSYCNLEYEYAGSNNISENPDFTGETDHPYNIHKSSYCLNAGKQDTTGLNLPQYDLLGNERIYQHTSSVYDRVDMGAYESPGILAPADFTASDGDNNYPGYVQLFWDYNEDYEPQPENFRVYRDGININTLDGQADSYSDYTAVPGQIYTYLVQASADSETRDSDEDSGYIKPNGIITGTVLSANNNPVQGVKVSLDPSPGFCLELDSSNSSSLTITNPEVNMDYNFTIEFWVKTFMNDVDLLRKGTHIFSLNSNNLVEYSDGSNTLIQQVDSLFLNDGEWHHLAVVNEYSNSAVKLYLDEFLIAEDDTFTFSGSSDAGFSTAADFSGFLDDIKIWATIRDSSQIAGGMYVIESWDAPGLAGYWPLNEGNGNAIFDATNYAHNGSISNCDWSGSDPGIMLGDYTDAYGEYSIGQIYYGSSTTFTVTPSKPDHFFQPEQRQITLNTSNTAQDNVDFTDNSLIPISGHVFFQGTQCPVELAEILLNGVSSSPPAFTDEDGYFVMEVEHGTECILTASYLDHGFNREWHLGAVTFPQTNIDFENIFKTEFRCEVVGGDDHYPIGDFDVTLQSVNGCYNQIIEAGSWATGGIMITDLPPLDFNVTVDPDPDNDPFVLALDDQFQSIKTQLISLSDPDSLLDTLRYVWKNDLQVNVAWPDTLQLYHFSDYPDNEFYVLSQNEWCELQVQALEDYSWIGHPNQITYLENFDLEINDEVGTKGESQISVQDTTVCYYSFAPYIPNMLSGYGRQYQNMLEIRAVDNATDRMTTQTDWVLIEGVRPTETTYSSTSPEIPFLILHDPPGDASFASFSQTSSHTTSLRAAVCTNQSASTTMNVHMGPDITYAAGSPFFSSEHTVDVTNDYSLGLSVNLNQSVSMEQSLTLTTSESYTTSSSDQVIGDGADVFVGGAINLIWGVTHELSWDDLQQDVIIDTSLMVTPDGFSTVYVYTDNQIRNTVIPNLYAIGDSASAELWQTYLDNNENNKSNAVANPNHPGNVSFNAGAGYSYEEQNTSVTSQTIEFNTTVSTDFGYHIGTVVDGVGTVNGYEFGVSLSVGLATSSSYQSTTTTSFTLADDDETSTLNFLPDYFTVDIKKDPVYGTPVFDLLSGASSCHWEPNTQPRDGVSMSANTYTASGLLEDEEAAFLLQLGNTTQTNEYRSYHLAIRQNTNPNGAIVKINGVLLEGTMSFSVPPGETVQAVMTVAKGPFAYEYEDLELIYYAPCDVGYPGPEGHDFWVTKSFDIYWEAPYSRVGIDSPQDNWLINQAYNDTLDIMFVDYDLTKENFRSIKLEYKHPQDVNWLPAFEIFRDSLLAHPHYINVPWDVSPIPDGAYQIRAAATDSLLSTFYSVSLSGIIDRSSPEILGNPQPADGILHNGDDISLTFAENIDPLSIDPGDVILTILSTGQVIDISADCYDNKLIITPNIANYWIENETLEAEVQGLEDLYGNLQTETISWEFFVNANPVSWDITKIEAIKELGESMDLTASLVNSGGQVSSFNLDDLPTWLTATPINGTLLPLDSQAFEFNVSEQLGFGTFVDTIYADVTSLGREPLVFEVSVLSNPPNWSMEQLGNFDYSMNITGQLSIDGEISHDLNDVIGAFVPDVNGDMECRGYASIELVPYFDNVFQFFLTVHSDNDYGEQLLFRVWDASESKEYFGIQENYQFMEGAIHGTPVTPEIVHTSDDLIRSTNCYTGWNWISLNLFNSNSMEIDSVLSTLSPQQNDFIKNQTDYAQFTPGLGWVGALDTLATTEMYKIKLSADDQLEIVGQLEDPVTTDIDYGSGWNWIGYLPHVSISVNQALADIDNLVTGDLLKNQGKFTQYIEGYGWFGSLLFMYPGEGYMLNTQNSGSFNYPDYVIENIDPLAYPEPKLKLPTIDLTGWQVNPLEYEYSSNITAVVQQNGNLLNSQDIVLAAFCGNECRGIAYPIEVQGQWTFFLTQYSNTINDTMIYKFYFLDTEETYIAEETFLFMNNQIIGDPLDPFVFHNTTGNLAAPQNLQIELIDGIIRLTWNNVTGATSYSVYSSTDPEIDYDNWTLEASGITETSWSEAVADIIKFYYIRAVNSE